VRDPSGQACLTCGAPRTPCPSPAQCGRGGAERSEAGVRGGLRATHASPLRGKRGGGGRASGGGEGCRTPCEDLCGRLPHLAVRLDAPYADDTLGVLCRPIGSYPAAAHAR